MAMTLVIILVAVCTAARLIYQARSAKSQR
jgi:hypothetical protein